MLVCSPKNDAAQGCRRGDMHAQVRGGSNRGMVFVVFVMRQRTEGMTTCGYGRDMDVSLGTCIPRDQTVTNKFGSDSPNQ